LDYTILNKEETNFDKKMEVFDLKKAIDETVGMQSDKVKMKEIKLT